MRKARLAGTFLLLCFSSLAFSCSNQESPSSSSESSSLDKVPLLSLSLSAEKTNLEVGEKVELKVTCLPEEASDKTYRYLIDDPSLASIEGDTLTALKAGQVSVSATSGEGINSSPIIFTIKERNITVDDSKYLLDMSKDECKTLESPTSENWGLSDPGNVGVDGERLTSEELYPVPTKNVLVYEAEQYGLEESYENNTGALTNLFTSLSKVEGTKVIKVKKGTYSFGGPIEAKEVKDCYLVGESGTKFVYRGWTSFLKVTSCENFHLNGITFDIDPSPTITGVVKKSEEDSSNGYVYLEVDEGYDLSNSQYDLYQTKKTGSYAEYRFDEKYQAYVPDLSKNLFYNPGLKDLEYDQSTNLLKVTLSKSFWACSYKAPSVGTIAAVAFQVYESHGFCIEDSINTYFEDVTAYTVGGMGLRANKGKNLYLNRVNFIREPGTKRLLTCTADILHTCNVEGEALFTNCVLEGSHDDAVNVKSFYTTITSIKGNVVSVKQTQSETTIDFSIGDQVDIYDPTGFKFKASYTVTEATKIGTNYDLTLDRSVPSRGTSSYVGFSLGNATKAIHLTMDNCLIKNKRNRGVLLQGRDSVIKNCTFQNVVMGAVQVFGVDDSFREAIVPQNVKLMNNKFLTCVSDIDVFTYDKDGVSTTGTLKQVEISNNFFYHGSGNSIRLLGTSDISVKNNLFYEKSSKTYSCLVGYTQDSELSGNATYCSSSLSNYSFAKLGSENENLTISNNELKGVL